MSNRGSHAQRGGRNRRFLGLCGLALLVTAGCKGELGGTGYQDDRSVIQVVSSNVQGKNVYIPSNIIATAGKDQQLSVYNTTDTAHGFSIAGIGIEAVLKPGEETLIDLPELEGGNVYHVHCHLHPPHRTGTLLVMPGR